MTSTPIAAVIAILAIGGTGLVCGTLLAIAARFCAVKEDPRVDELLALLPGANCGACGLPGCSEYAKNVLWHGAPINLCRRGGNETLEKLAAHLKVQAEALERHVAIVLCQGGDSVAISKALYNGIADCRAAELAGGASKACRYGCMGLGTCARVCPENAIEITSDNLAVVHPELCIGCGLCISKCPRGLIKLVPESRSIHILCSSKDRGPVVRKLCSVGCIACTVCVKIVDGKGLKMEGSLAVMDYSTPLENEDVIAKCPQHTIVKRSGRKQSQSGQLAA